MLSIQFSIQHQQRISFILAVIHSVHLQIQCIKSDGLNASIRYLCCLTDALFVFFTLSSATCKSQQMMYLSTDELFTPPGLSNSGKTP